jgi:hypothetical protein
MMRKERPTPRSPKAKQMKSLLATVKITPCDPPRVRNLPGENTLSVQARLGASRGHGSNGHKIPELCPSCLHWWWYCRSIVEAVDWSRPYRNRRDQKDKKEVFLMSWKIKILIHLVRVSRGAVQHFIMIPPRSYLRNVIVLQKGWTMGPAHVLGHGSRARPDAIVDCQCTVFRKNSLLFSCLRTNQNLPPMRCGSMLRPTERL